MNQDKLLDFKTVVERYHFKPWGLRHRIKLRKIPFVKLGRSIYFDPKDLDEWINKNKIKVIETGGEK